MLESLTDHEIRLVISSHFGWSLPAATSAKWTTLNGIVVTSGPPNWTNDEEATNKLVTVLESLGVTFTVKNVQPSGFPTEDEQIWVKLEREGFELAWGMEPLRYSGSQNKAICKAIASAVKLGMLYDITMF